MIGNVYIKKRSYGAGIKFVVTGVDNKLYSLRPYGKENVPGAIYKINLIELQKEFKLDSKLTLKNKLNSSFG